MTWLGITNFSPAISERLFKHLTPISKTNLVFHFVASSAKVYITRGRGRELSKKFKSTFLKIKAFQYVVNVHTYIWKEYE